MISCDRPFLIRPEHTNEAFSSLFFFYSLSLLPSLFFLLVLLRRWCSKEEGNWSGPRWKLDSTWRIFYIFQHKERGKETRKRKKKGIEGIKKREKRRGRCLQAGWRASTESSIDWFIDPKTVARANIHTLVLHHYTARTPPPSLSLFLSLSFSFSFYSHFLPPPPTTMSTTLSLPRQVESSRIPFCLGRNDSRWK